VSERVVDLRSDTVTRPTAAMRRAIADAEVGDDALGDDPTTRRLEARVAELLGKEAALFFPSGIMANQTALAVLGAWGGEVVVDAGSHVFHYEEGAAAALSGIQLLPVASRRGILVAEDVEAAVRTGSRYNPRTCAIALENTHLDSGGRVLPLSLFESVGEIAARRGLSVHLDGARLWHACAESGASPAAYCRRVDTAMVSFSKGLGAPVGSALAGERAVMDEAWRVRRRLGGGMRQSGILAAAAIHALDHHRDRLVEDHRNARRLAAAFRRIPGFDVDVPETNIVLVETRESGVDVPGLLSFLEKRRFLLLKFDETRIRAVTHLDVDSESITLVVNALEEWAGG
jgi:threonine aldolase